MKNTIFSIIFLFILFPVFSSDFDSVEKAKEFLDETFSVENNKTEKYYEELELPKTKERKELEKEFMEDLKEDREKIENREEEYKERIKEFEKDEHIYIWINGYQKYYSDNIHVI